MRDIHKVAPRARPDLARAESAADNIKADQGCKQAVMGVGADDPLSPSPQCGRGRGRWRMPREGEGFRPDGLDKFLFRTYFLSKRIA